MPAPEALSFDTETLPPSERMDRYRALYGIGADIRATGSAPRATFQGWRLDRAILYDRHLNDIGHSRAAAALPRYNLSHWTVTMVMEGWFGVDWGNGLRQLRPGELLFIDTNTPGLNDARRAHVTTLSIAQDRLEELVGSSERLHGMVVPVEHGRLYAGFVRSLLDVMPTVDRRALPAMTSALGMMLKAALQSHGWGTTGASPAQGHRASQVRALIDARCSDPTFDIDAAVEESGLSRATLYRLLRTDGGLATLIQRLRLERIRRQLSDPLDRRQFAEVAREAGFLDEGQASRAFKSRFGVRPGAYRAAVVQDEPDGRFRAWQQDLR